MHLPVQRHEALLVAIGNQSLLDHQVAPQLSQLVVGDAGGDPFGGGDLDRLSDESALTNVGHRQTRDKGARLRDHIDQTIGGQTRDGIGHRAARHAQTVADVRFADHLAGAIAQRQDGLAQRLIDALAE